VSFVAITLCIASQQVFFVVVDFVMESVRKLLDTHSYFLKRTLLQSVSQLVSSLNTGTFVLRLSDLEYQKGCSVLLLIV
jgi:hypothetical protein